MMRLGLMRGLGAERMRAHALCAPCGAPDIGRAFLHQIVGVGKLIASWASAHVRPVDQMSHSNGTSPSGKKDQLSPWKATVKRALAMVLIVLVVICLACIQTGYKAPMRCARVPCSLSPCMPALCVVHGAGYRAQGSG